jgi:hypothetical protein
MVQAFSDLARIVENKLEDTEPSNLLSMVEFHSRQQLELNHGMCSRRTT